VLGAEGSPCARCGAKLKVVRGIRRLKLTFPQYASSSVRYRATRRP
jgi:hypothetical protein